MKPRKTLHRNIFIFSIAALALASVGFSSWIIGQVNADKQISASVEINGPTSKVFIGDLTYKNPDQGLSLSFDNANGDHDIGIKTITTVVSSNLKSGSYDISFDKTTADQNKASLILDSGETTDVFGRDKSKTYNYLSFADSQMLTADKLSFNYPINIGQLKPYPNTEFKQFDIDVSALNITYGSYFDFKNPQQFYDTKLDVLKNEYTNATGANRLAAKEKYIKATNQAITELNNFVSSFTNKTIIIDIKGNYVFEGSEGGTI